MTLRKEKITFTELADLCHELNTLTNRQYRPGHQLVKLFNSLSQFSRSGEFYKDDDQVLRLFSTYNPEYKQTLPYIVNNLAKFIVLPESEKKQELQNFAKQLDEHEQWEWESRRKAKTRRKQHHGKSPAKYLESPAFTPVAGMNSLSRPTSSATLSSMSSTNTLSSMSSEEPEEMGYQQYGYLREFDPVWEDRVQKMPEHPEEMYGRMEKPQERHQRPYYYRNGGHGAQQHFQTQHPYHRGDPAAQYRQEREPSSHCRSGPPAAAARMPFKGKSIHATTRHISAQLHQSPQERQDFQDHESVLALGRWEWNDKHYSELVNRLYEDEHLSPYVNPY